MVFQELGNVACAVIFETKVNDENGDDNAVSNFNVQVVGFCIGWPENFKDNNAKKKNKCERNYFIDNMFDFFPPLLHISFFNCGFINVFIGVEVFNQW